MARKKPTTALESVAQSIGSAVGIAVRTVGEVEDRITVAVKKVTPKLPKKKTRKALISRAKKLAGAGQRRVKTTAKTVVRPAKSKRGAAKLRKK